MAPESGQDLFHIKKVLLKRGAKTQDVVHVDHRTPSERTGRPRDAASVSIIPPARTLRTSPCGEGCIHDPHQEGRGPLKAVRDDLPLELAKLRPKARFPPILLPHTELVVGGREVQLREETGSARAVQQRVDVWERFHRRARDRVEAPVVVADAPTAVGFAGKHHCSRVAGG